MLICRIAEGVHGQRKVGSSYGKVYTSIRVYSTYRTLF